MMKNPIFDKTHQAFSIAFFSALVGALNEASGSTWLIAAVPDAELTSNNSEPVQIRLTLDGSLRGEFLLEFRRAEAAMLESKILRQPAVELAAEQSERLLMLIRDGISEFISALAKDYGTFTIEASLASEPALDAASAAQFTVADDEANRVSILMFLNPALAEALSLHSQARKMATRTERSIKSSTGGVAPEQNNLNLVMDVELNVTLRFGQRQLTLREVLELTSGSVVELDRQVEEPVELLLEGKVIARGEAVVIDGNYGLRVIEVLQPIFPSILC
jgi:flagellar motor switch protein FliN/FliY